MPSDTPREAISKADAWYHSFGNTSLETPLATFVMNEAHPGVWDSNHVSRVRAREAPEIEAVFGDMERVFAHCSDRAAVVDDFTPGEFVARLAFDDFKEQAAVIQMALLADIAPFRPAGATMREAESEAGWESLRRLFEADFAEGRRIGAGALPQDVVSGLFAGYRAKRQIAPFFIAEARGVPCAYACAAHCPDGVGIIDNVFTLPAFRGRGIASSLIAHGVARLRASGRRRVFIGALARERAKHLYAKLGFTPVMISRKWVKG